MASYQTLEEARELFKKDRFATDSGMEVVSISDDEAVTRVVLNDGHKNAYGGIMGGAIFTLADFAFAILSNNIIQL